MYLSHHLAVVTQNLHETGPSPIILHIPHHSLLYHHLTLTLERWKRELVSNNYPSILIAPTILTIHRLHSSHSTVPPAPTTPYYSPPPHYIYHATLCSSILKCGAQEKKLPSTRRANILLLLLEEGARAEEL